MRTKEGDILGLLPGIFTAIHMDNKENYQRHARNPSEALTSGLVIAGQQPLSSNKIMQLESENNPDTLAQPLDSLVDSESEIESCLRPIPDLELLEDDTEDNEEWNTIPNESIAILNQENDNYPDSETDTNSQDGYQSDSVASQCSQMSETSQTTDCSQSTGTAEDSDSTIAPEITSPVKTRSATSASSTGSTSVKRPPSSTVRLNPRAKRLR